MNKKSNPEPNEAVRLLDEYVACAQRYASAITELSTRIGVVPKAEYEILQQQADSAQEALNKLKAYQEEHGY